MMIHDFFLQDLSLSTNKAIVNWKTQASLIYRINVTFST